MKRYGLHLLLGVNVLLALGLAWLWLLPNGTLRNTRWQPPSPQRADYAAMLPALRASTPSGTAEFVAILDRPLFSTTRRPPPPPPPPVAPPPVDNLSSATLSGIMGTSQGGTAIVNIAGKNRRVKLNDVVDGWTLQSMDGRSVTFASGGQTRTLQLARAKVTAYTGGASAIAPSAPPAARPAAPAAAPANPAGTNPSPAEPPRPRAVFGGGAARP